MELIIDIRHLYAKDTYYLPKEVAIVSVAENFIAHWIVKPPTSFSSLPPFIQQTNNTLTRFVHGLEWTSGDIELADLEANLKQIVLNVSEIYAIGENAVSYLTDLLGRKVIDMLHHEVPSFHVLHNSIEHPSYSGCMMHAAVDSNPNACPLYRAGLLRDWVHKEYHQVFGKTLFDTWLNKTNFGDQELFKLFGRRSMQRLAAAKKQKEEKNTQAESTQNTATKSPGRDVVDSTYNVQKKDEEVKEAVKEAVKKPPIKPRRVVLQEHSEKQEEDNLRASKKLLSHEHVPDLSSSEGPQDVDRRCLRSRPDSEGYVAPHSYNCKPR